MKSRHTPNTHRGGREQDCKQNIRERNLQTELRQTKRDLRSRVQRLNLWLRQDCNEISNLQSALREANIERSSLKISLAHCKDVSKSIRTNMLQIRETSGFLDNCASKIERHTEVKS
jgi:predicted RNase H-like nuclease (RuvC/YqgF family)